MWLDADGSFLPPRHAAATSVGLVDGEPLLTSEYARTLLPAGGNVVMDRGRLSGSRDGEQVPFERKRLDAARSGGAGVEASGIQKSIVAQGLDSYGF
jgi:hypothetical protein